MTCLSGTLAILPKLTVNGSIAHGSMVMPDMESFQAYHLGASNVVAIFRPHFYIWHTTVHVLRTVEFSGRGIDTR